MEKMGNESQNGLTLVNTEQFRALPIVIELLRLHHWYWPALVPTFGLRIYVWCTLGPYGIDNKSVIIMDFSIGITRDYSCLDLYSLKAHSHHNYHTQIQCNNKCVRFNILFITYKNMYYEE